MKPRIKRPSEVKKNILPIVGRIKTGIKGEKYPKSIDYFIATGNYQKYFHHFYGEKPNKIQVVFLSDDPADGCFERYEYRDENGDIYAKGDGETFQVWNGKKYVETTIKQKPNFMNDCENHCKSKRGWETILTLRFLLPKVNGILGLWEYTTRAEQSSIPNITGTFDTFLEQKGFIRGIVFDLTVQFAKSQKPNNASRYPVVNLIPNMTKDNIESLKDAMINLQNQIPEKSNNKN